MEFQPLMAEIDETISGLQRFPTLVDLVTCHEDPEDVRETSRMADWISQGDHLQIEQDLKLRGDVSCFLEGFGGSLGFRLRRGGGRLEGISDLL